jgi:hypothetical protein
MSVVHFDARSSRNILPTTDCVWFVGYSYKLSDRPRRARRCEVATAKRDQGSVPNQAVALIRLRDIRHYRYVLSGRDFRRNASHNKRDRVAEIRALYE